MYKLKQWIKFKMYAQIGDEGEHIFDLMLRRMSRK